MSSGMLSLKWNNHRSTFFHVLSSIRSKESYCDATLACDGRFYPVHKLVLSTCSEYFEQIFEKTQCKHPVIVLKDIKFDDLEALMNYMYVGEVNVLQEKLSGLIKAAECLKIKGLAVPDEDPFASKENRRNQHRAEFESPRAKRRRKESFSNEDRGKNLSHRSQPRERQTNEILENVNLSTPKSTETNLSQILGGNTLSKADKSSEEIVHDNSEEDEQSSSKQFNSDGLIKKVSSHKRKGEISLIEANVKAEPPDIDIPDEDNLDSKENLHTDLGYDPNAGDLESLVDDESGSAHGGNDSEFSENILESAPQSVEDVVAQALPSSSNFQGNSFSLWEGDNSLQSFPGEGYSGDNSQGRQMVDSLQGDGSWISTGENADQKILKIVAVNSLQSDSKKKWIMSADTLTNLIQYKCSLPTCPKTFSCPSAVKIHERVHTRERPFRCNICPFRANQKGNLVAHMRIHTLNNPYTCDYCHAKFRSSSNLTRHISTLHNT